MPARMSETPTTKLKIEKSLLKRARANDEAAIETMFRQFIGADERVYLRQYFGTQGFWGIGKRSFGCLTDKRICSLTVGFLGEVTFVDAYLEHSNGGIMYQPSLVPLIVMATPVVLLTFGIGILLLPIIAQLYYRFFKSGLVWVIREGVPIYLFCNRSLMNRANHLYREASKAREARLIVSLSR